MIPVRRIAVLAAASLSLIAATAATPALRSRLGPLLDMPRAGDGMPATSAAVLESEAEQTSKDGGELRSPLWDDLGTSGNLRAWIGTRASLSQSPALQPLLAGLPPDQAGVHSLEQPAPDGDSLSVVLLESFGARKGTRVGGYRVGRWPSSGAAAGNSRYAEPAGFIEVIPENQNTMVSKRFRLRDFLTHDQKDVWPKVLVLQPALLDKLELIGDELERRGLPSSIRIMSGFRTPQYNAQGVGHKGGRASASRHMYGDAADVFVDGNEDGRMDDLNGDGKSTARDAKVLFAIAEGVEAQHPELVGGLSAYPANSSHGPFVHVDARGVRARW